MSDDRTEEATPKKLRDARARGEVARARLLAPAVTTLFAAAALAASGAAFAESAAACLGATFTAVERGAPPTATLSLCLGAGASAVAPLVLGVFVAAAMVTFLDVGPLLSLGAVAPRGARLDPISNLGSMFSRRRVVDVAQHLLVAVALGYAAFDAARDLAPHMLALARGRPPALVGGVGELVVSLLVRLGCVLIAFAALDLLLSRLRYREDQRMTKEEVKREHRESEGDPHAKHARAAMHREILAHAVLEEVRRADVLVVNPTHLAIALRYDADVEDAAPVVLGKGEDELARRMIDAAREAGVPVLRDVPLAHALHVLDEGSEIPEALYEAVALVLRTAWEERGGP